MEKLEFKYLAPYLTYGLMMYFDDLETFELCGYDGNLNECLVYRNIDGDVDNICTELLKPILRPLSDLTKEIEINGEKFVPEKRLNIYGGLDYFVEQIKLGLVAHITMQKLFEWHFDCFDLLSKNLAIDINTL